MHSTGWFGIDSQGWRRVNAGRFMGHLVREGISNVFDLDDVRNATVLIEKGHVVIEDDASSGFGDPNLIFTVFMTGKEDLHTKRGRKGRGLKELISAADKAIVETAGYTLTFDESGRTQEENKRKQGTRVEIWSSLENWNEEEAKKTEEYLRTIIPPPAIKFVLNGKEIHSPLMKDSLFDISLPTTVIKNDVETELHTHTRVDLHESKKGNSWVYEMGIPIQAIDHPFHINVHQRIPMNDNRDTVQSHYLRFLSSRILKKILSAMNKKDLRGRWVADCLYLTDIDTRRRYSEKLLGPGVVLKTDNKRANDIAKQHGYELVALDHLSEDVSYILKDYIQDSESVARVILESRRDVEVYPTEDQAKFARVVEWFGQRLLKKDIVCSFFSRDKDITGHIVQADFNAARGAIRFNVSHDCNDFTKPLGQAAISTMVHEFAHNKYECHDEDFLAEVERLSGAMIYLVLHFGSDIEKKFGKLKYMPGKTIMIICEDCGKEREIKVQDKFQVRKCVECKKKRRKV